MTYLDYLNAFYRWQKTNYMSGNAKLLYYEILGLFNEAGWPESIQLDNYRLMWMVDTRTERVAIAARDKLVELGFIEYKKGRKGSPNTYSLTKYTLQKVSESDSVSVSENDSVFDSESDSVSVSEKCSHIKTKIKTKTKKSPLNPPAGEDGGGFLQFWQAYPRKIGKGDARKSWGKLCPDDELLGVILAAVERDKLTGQWRRDGGQFIPYPATWLNQRRWEDEPDITAEAGQKDGFPDYGNEEDYL